MSVSDSAYIAPGAVQPAEAELDLKVLFGALWRHKMWIIVPTLLALIGSYLLVNMLTPKYASEARLFIENSESIYTRPGGERQQGSEALPIDAEAVASQVQMLYSRDLARAVIRKLGLNSNPEFDPMLRGRSIVSVLASMAGFIRDPAALTAEERVLETYFERLAVYPVERSRVIEVKFLSKNPDLAAQITNAIVEQYLEAQARSKLDRDRRANQSLERKIDDLRQAVAEAEARAQEFRIRNDILLGPQSQTLSSQQLGEISSQISVADAQRAEAQAKANTIRDLLKAGRSVEAFENINSPLIGRLAEQRATLRAEMAQALTTLLPAHPRMREMRAQIADIEGQIRTEAQKVARGFDNEARVAAARVEAIRQNMSAAKRQNAATGDQEVTLRALEREAKAQRDLLESWLGLYRESSARVSADARPADARVVSTAQASNTPAFPKKGPIMMVTTLGTAMLMMVIIFMRELASGRAFVVHGADGQVLARAEPVFDAAMGSHVGTGREARFDAPMAALHRQSSDPYEAIWADVMKRFATPRSARANKRILVTGALGSDHSGAFATGLARHIDGIERRVILLDLNFASPALGSMLRAQDLPGISDLLVGQTQFGDTIHMDHASGVHVVPVGRSVADCTNELLSGARFYTILSAFEAAYDHLVVLAPSIIDADDVAGLVPKVDVIFLDAHGAPDEVSAACHDALVASGARDLEMIVPGIGRVNAREALDKIHTNAAA